MSCLRLVNLRFHELMTEYKPIQIRKKITNSIDFFVNFVFVDMDCLWVDKIEIYTLYIYKVYLLTFGSIIKKNKKATLL